MESSVKTCSTCRRVVPIGQFNKDRSRKDGLDPRCKSCARARVLRRYEENREKLVEAQRQYRRDNPEKSSASCKAWREANPGYGKSIARREYLKGYYLANPDKYKVNCGLRRARLAGATVEKFNAVDLAVSYRARGLESCVYCSQPREHDDHIVPIARGGYHATWNLVPACAACNKSKGARDVLNFLAGRAIPKAVLDALERHEHVAESIP